MPNDSEARKAHDVWYRDKYSPPERGPMHRAVSLAAWMEGWRQATEATKTARAEGAIDAE